MTTRRPHQVLGTIAHILAAVAVLGASGHAVAQAQLRKVTVVFASTNFPLNTATLTSLPQVLGYFRDEGLDVDLQGAAGSLPSVQMVTGGKAEVGVAQPITLFQVRPKGAKVKAFYTAIRHNWFYPCVLDTSPIRNLGQFKGKRIGVQSMGASMIPFMKLVLADAGLDPEKDVSFVGVGLGAGAAALLKQGQVDVLGLWSAQYAAMENAGFRFRKFVDVAPIKDMTFSVAFVASDDWLRENPKVAIGLGRSYARATLFALHNPEAAVRLHWKMYPQLKPAGEDDATAMRKAVHELKDGLKYMRIDTAKVKKWGMTTPEEVESYAKVLTRAKMIEGAIGPASDYFDADLIDSINEFDARKVIEQARHYKMQ